ncbi:MAG: dihydroorotase [Elusimicrobiota bacterium]
MNISRIIDVRVVDPASGCEYFADLTLQKGFIVKIEHKNRLGHVRGQPLDSKESSGCPRISRGVLQARGACVSPSLWDLHVHLREPGQEQKETILTGAGAAVRGGVGHLFAMPNTQPAIDSEEILTAVTARAAEAAHLADIGFFAAATIARQGAKPVDVYRLSKLGAVGFSDDGSPIGDARLLRMLLDETSALGSFVADHCEMPDLMADGVMHEGRHSRHMGLPGIPRQAEYLAVSRDIEILKISRGRLHLAHLSTRESVEAVRRAKHEGLAGRLTCEACPHHFSLTHDAIKLFGPNAKVNPPLREKDDLDAIIDGLQDGTIDAIASDHAPHCDWEKDKGMIEAPFGLIGLETMLPVTLTYLVRQGRLPLMRAIELLTVGPAKVLGRAVPAIAVGQPADLVIFDPECEVVFDSFVSKSRNSPYLGHSLYGKVVATLRKGRMVYPEGSA